MKTEKLIIDLATDFVQNHYDEVSDTYKSDRETKEELMDDIIEDYYTASWVISELMHWTKDENQEKYIDRYNVECDNTLVIKIDNTYFKLNDDRCFVKAEPKTKTVVYFD
jgi:hypothetical protein